MIKKTLFYHVSFVIVIGLTIVTVLNEYPIRNINDNETSSIGYYLDSNPLFDNDKRVNNIQQQISSIYNNLLQCVIRVEVGNNAASAVMVSEDGYILTAAHVIDAVGGKEAKVRLHDGSEYVAKCLGKDDIGDYGLMKINPTKKVFYAILGSAKDLAKDETCLMFGHAASKDKMKPAIGRIGFYKEVLNNYLRTSCIMMPGDSGGPLFDLNGKVIGICSYINRPLDQNYFPSIDNVKKNWEKLLRGDNMNGQEINDKESFVIAPEKDKPFVLDGGKSTLIEIISKNNKKVKKAVVIIESFLNNKKTATVTQGTILSKKGYIVGKSSQIGIDKVYVTLYNGIKVKAKIIGRDKTNDIVVLQINDSEKLNPISLKLATLSSGQLIGAISNLENSSWGGIVGLEARQIKNTNIGYLGIVYSPNNKLKIDRVIENTPAYNSGLIAGDNIVRFESIILKERSDLLKALSKTLPGEKIKLTISRNEQERDIMVVLGRKTSHNNRHSRRPADYVNVHKRKDGFPNAFTHDIPLKINESGTPVVNLNGAVIGINIARRNRTSSLSIPMLKVKAIVQKILDSNNLNAIH